MINEEEDRCMSATTSDGKGNSLGSAALRYEATGASRATDALGLREDQRCHDL